MTDATAPTHKAICAPRDRRYVLIAAILASALGFIDGTVVAIAMPAIRDSLGASLSDAQWISNAYMLTLSALILVGGAAGDRFGMARVFGGGIALFIVASLFCAVAPNAETLIPARAIQGIGAAFMVPGSLAMISRAYPKAERGRAIGTWAAAAALTTALGPVIGGLALTAGGPDMWRWIFAVNLPLGAFALWLLWTRVAADPSEATQGIDIPGALLATLGLGLIAWSLTGVEGGHETQGALFFGVAGALILGLFLVVEARSPHPMMPLGLFRNPTFSAANAATFLLYFALSAVLFFLPMTVISAWGVSEAEVSFAFLPLTIFIAGLSSRFGKLADRTGPGPLIAGGAVLVSAAYAALALTAPAQAYWETVLPAMCLMGLGMSLVVAPLSTAVMGAVDDNETGAASGINNAITRIAGLVAVAIMGTVAAATYTAAGGDMSFGIKAPGVDHANATTAAFATIAWITAGLAFASAVVAYIGIRKADSDQTGS